MGALGTLERAMEEAQRKAFDSLAGYKFIMFGYHAAQWVQLADLWRQETGKRLPNPFRPLVMKAREVKRHGH